MLTLCNIKFNNMKEEVKEVSSLDKKKKEYFEKAIEVIRNNQFIFQVQDVFDLMGISRSTFYAYYPDGSDELDAIKKHLNSNKVSERVKVRKRWSEEPSPKTDPMYYKLIATDDERRLLSTQFVETRERTPQELSEQELNEKIEKLSK